MFFEALNYETIEQKKAYEVAGLLGNTAHCSMNTVSFIFLSLSVPLNHRYIYVAGDIGGQMGLFIGASILTILELFDYAYEVFQHLKKRLKMNYEVNCEYIHKTNYFHSYV